MRIKRSAALLLAVLTALALSACGQAGESSGSMSVAPAQLTQEETALTELLGLGMENYRIFDYQVGGGVQSIQLTVYELVGTEWEPKVNAIRSASTDPKGRIALAFGRMTEGVRVSFQSENSYSVWVNVGFTLLSILITLFLIGKEENSAYKIAWIILILCLPLFGGLLYLFFGNKNPSKNMKRRLKNSHRAMAKGFRGGLRAIEDLRKLDGRAAGVSTYLKNASDYGLHKNTDVRYYPLGELLFEDLLEDLERAQYYIFMEYFIIEEGFMWDRILQILERKVSEGVDVRLIYDDMGCVSLLPKGYDKWMEQKGIRCMAFNRIVPFFAMVMNHRDHRKITVIDGHTAYTGGINLADEYINVKKRFGHWKDSGIRLEGEAVWNFTLMFLEMWNAYRKEDGSLEQFKPWLHHPEPFSGSED